MAAVKRSTTKKVKPKLKKIKMEVVGFQPRRDLFLIARDQGTTGGTTGYPEVGLAKARGIQLLEKPRVMEVLIYAHGAGGKNVFTVYYRLKGYRLDREM